MKKFLLSWVCLLLFVVLSAQQLSGKVLDDEGNPLNNASVFLQRAHDSAVLKLTVTKDSGYFSFSVGQSESYIISASFTGYKTGYSHMFRWQSSAASNNIRIMLQKAGKDLEEVSLFSKKPMLEIKGDKMIMHVEGTINAAGTDALELLRKAPGVNVDNEDNIVLSGKSGTQVFIDGKPTPLSRSDLGSYLKSIQAAQIESIEIITNPSAKYEAAGNGGILNIRLKKNKAFGTNGSLNVGYGIGVFAKYNGGLSLNYRNKRVNLFGTYTHNRGINRLYTTAYRVQQDTLYDQHFERIMHENGHNIKAGLDYSLSPVNTFGVILNTVFGTQYMEEPGQTIIAFAPTGQFNKTLVSTSLSDSRRANTNINLNYRYEKKNKELNIDVDYGKYALENERLQPNAYYGVSGDFLYGRTYNMLTPMDIQLSSAKLNHVRNLRGGKLDLGGKASKVTNDNDFQRFDVFNNGKQLDSARSNAFLYKEEITALYLNYNKEQKKFLWQVGVRMENTAIRGRSSGYRSASHFLPFDSSFSRKYTDLFPSVSLTWRKNDKSQIGFTYSRRIDRPVYQFLNPFEYKLDEYTYRKGNTALQPQYTNSVGLTYTYNNKLTASLAYSHIRSLISQIFDTTKKTKSFITNTNLAKQEVVSLNLNYAVQAKRFSGFINVNSFYAHSSGDFGKGRTIDMSMVTVNIRSQQNLKIGRTFVAELVEYYSSPYIWEGTMKNKSLASIDAGLQKNIKEGKATIKASVTDIFFTMQARLVNRFAGQNQLLGRIWEPRLFRINVTYRFGSSQVKAARQRKTGLEEESKRVQSGS